MALNIATDVLDMASSIGGNLRHSFGIMGSFRTAAMSGPVTVDQALKAHETLASAIRWADGLVTTPGIENAFSTRFGSNPATIGADWAEVKRTARALLNGLYNVLPKAADGTVQIYSSPDPVTAERALLQITLTTGQKTAFNDLWSAMAATVALA
jgi:hypothetical protein